MDLSMVEMAVIALVALLVLGPEKLPRAARTVGLYARRARNSWNAVRADIERELAADDLKRSMQAQVDSVREPLRALQRDLSAPLDRGDPLDGPLSRQTPPDPDTAATRPVAGEAGDADPARDRRPDHGPHG